ncbi:MULTISPECIES: Rieske (2Fe-2S) protein [Chryseobacterium group]|uniref:Rieske 2Fe-2S domain-containing protein n=3 Tax=Chryseobacterium TaxID=59732 RepID=A0A848N8F6_9FLAO|nr:MULTISPECIES: Rieske 2Fe-2S domain-containing protein [Chryseobacterium group]EFK35968.1 rieske [2Fe-2S] domain protein [Chryseobacterium gleum ATCC 35910]NMR35252.1 Rieske 2Fe-2S domain-containing protein [Chryseobacterium aquaticum]NRQ47311.1 Rieske 2Fe-2S domain-containing protein [Chryseobacterium sp. C-204]QQY31678.1 Rieske 2Fe-2S domain-containing protein [Chryseobacterium gleum]WBX96485.1 Rieske 2Fe-2S domain-containing protein [Chryseobacterium gambrini]
MDRLEFIKKCGFACLGLTALPIVLSGCISNKIVAGTIEEDYIILPLVDFVEAKYPDKKRSYVIIQNDILKYPICVFRFSETEYEALWMQCSHQGSQLQVFGDKLQCPAHGSEFTNKGHVQNGPADRALRKFPVYIEFDFLKISLKKPV